MVCNWWTYRVHSRRWLLSLERYWLAQLAAGTAVAVQYDDGRSYRATVLGGARGGYYVAFPDGRQLWVAAQFVRPAVG